VARFHGERFLNIRQAKDAVSAWSLLCNRQRLHSTLNYLSPMEFESRWGDQRSTFAGRSMNNVAAEQTVEMPAHVKRGKR